MVQSNVLKLPRVLGGYVPGRGEDAITRLKETNIGPLSDQSDAELVNRTIAGEIEAYGELVRRHQSLVYSIARRILFNPEDAEDVAAEVFIQAYKSLSSFKSKSAFATWLYRMTVNRSLRFSKKRSGVAMISIDAPNSAVLDSLASPESELPDFVLEAQEHKKALHRAVAELPEKQRLPIILHYFIGLSCEETADVLGCTVGTVWSRLHYACKKLKNSLNWLADGGI